MFPSHRLVRCSLVLVALCLGLPSCAPTDDSSSATGTTAQAVTGTPAFVQQHYACPQSARSSVAVAYSAQTAGNTNIVAVGWNDTTTSVTSVTDSFGNTYAQAVGTFRGNNLSQAIYYARNIKAGTGNSVTVKLSRSAPYVDLRITEYSGLDATAPFVAGASATGVGTSASSGAVTTTSANTLLFGAGMTTDVFTAAGSGYTSRVITNPDADIVEDRIAATTGSYDASAPASSGGWVFQVAAFKAAGASSGSDTQAPTVPASLSASAPSSSQIDLSWAASTDNVGVVGYRIYRGGSLLTTATGTAYSNTGLTASTTYSYQVSAIDAAGNESAMSTAASATTQASSQGTVGPIVPVGPIANVSCSGVTLAPGASIQSAVDANPTGTTFCLQTGTYARQSVIPKTGDKFIGALGTVLDGQSATHRAFDGTASNVLIQNLVIQNYTAGSQDAPLYGESGSGWTVKNNEIRNNPGAGLMIGDGMFAQGNYLHHNLQEGYACCGPQGTGIVFDSNEIAFNNYTNAFDPGWEAGGGKFWATSGLMVTHNYSHDNHGPGLWDDTDNIDITYAFNRVENNWGGGIFHEVGYNASIHDNVAKNNANTSLCPGWLWCADIQIAASGGVNGGMVEIFNNTVQPDGSQHGNGIALIQQDRGTGAHGPYLVQNVYVHDNHVNLSSGGDYGAVEDLSSTAIFTSRNNRFDYNTYTLGTNTGPFQWMDADGNKSFWQGFGLDTHAVFQ